MSVLRTILVTGILVSLVPSQVLAQGPSSGARQDGQSGQALPWPSVGPSWETDPAVAFSRAREEQKGVFVYVATAG